MLINVTVPVYNTKREWLLEAVASVMYQTEKNWKLILCDDGSTNPETIDLLRGLEVIPNIHVIRNGVNRGIAHTRNNCLDALDEDCEYVAIFDHDDIMMKNRLEKQLKYMQSHDVDFLGAQLAALDCVNVDKPNVYNNTKHPSIITKEIVCKSNWFVNNPTLMIRRSVYDRVGKYSTEKHIVDNGIEDYEFITRAFVSGCKIHNLEEALIKYRLHTGQASRRDGATALKYVNEIFERTKALLES